MWGVAAGVEAFQLWLGCERHPGSQGVWHVVALGCRKAFPGGNVVGGLKGLSRSLRLCRVCLAYDLTWRG